MTEQLELRLTPLEDTKGHVAYFPTRQVAFPCNAFWITCAYNWLQQNGHPKVKVGDLPLTNDADKIIELKEKGYCFITIDLEQFRTITGQKVKSFNHRIVLDKTPPKKVFTNAI